MRLNDMSDKPTGFLLFRDQNDNFQKLSKSLKSSFVKEYQISPRWLDLPALAWLVRVPGWQQRQTRVRTRLGRRVDGSLPQLPSGSNPFLRAAQAGN